MIESFPTDPLTLWVISVGAVTAAMSIIWKVALKPFGHWVGDAVRNLFRIADLLERMVKFLENERESMLSRIDEVERQNVEGAEIHEELLRAKDYAMRQAATIAGEHAILDARVESLERKQP